MTSLASIFVLVLLLILIVLPSITPSQLPNSSSHRPDIPFHHEYKHSLRRPYFFSSPANSDNSKQPSDGNAGDAPKSIPYYDFGGGARPGPAGYSLRLVPSVPRARGIVVSRIPLRAANDDITALAPGLAQGWDFQLTFRLTPSQFTVNAATSGNLNGVPAPGVGLALWLTTTPLPKDPSPQYDINDPKFGVDLSDFDGLRIAIQPTPSQLYPGHVRVSGTMSFNIAGTQVDLGRCEMDLRSNNSPAVISVMYHDDTKELAVWVDSSSTKLEWSLCFSRIVDIPPRGGYLAVSGANGDLDRTDDIDVVSLDVYALNPVARSRPEQNKPQQGMSAISFEPDKKVLDHAHEVEGKVHKRMEEEEREEIKLAEAQEQANGGSIGNTGVNKSGTGGVIQQSGTGDTRNMEVILAQLSTQVQNLANDVTTIKAMVSAVDKLVGDNTKSSEQDSTAGQWRSTIETKLNQLSMASETRHKEIVDLIHNVRGTGESAQVAASQAHAAAKAAVRVASETQEKPMGPSWMTLFGLMLGAQCVGMVLVTVWRTIRGGGQSKKYL